MNEHILTEYSPQYEHALAHHGVKGQKWGVRRYQPYSTTGKRKSGKGGSEVGLAAKRAGQAASDVGYGIGRKMRSASNGLARKMQAHSEARKEKKAAKEAEKERKRVLKEERQKAKYSSSAGQALKNKSKFTTEELKQVKDRLQVEQSLADMKQKDFDRGVKYIKAIAQIATSSYEVGDILSQVVTGKKIAEYRKDKIAKDEAAKAAKEADKAAKDKGGGSSKSETSKTSEHSTTSKTTKDDKKKTKEAKGPKLINPIFDTKSNTGAPVSIFGESKTSDVVSAVDEALKGLRKADIDYRTKHARETPTLEWGTPGHKEYTTTARTLSEQLLDDISSLKIDGDSKTDYSKMDPTNNVYDDRKKKVKHGEDMRGRTIQVYVPDYNGYLAHHGIKGQKWGRRRYQNEDGTLTPAGKQRERSGGGVLKAGPVSVNPVRLAGGVARAVKNDIAGRAEANKRMARIDAATNRPVGREKNVTGSAYIGKGPSPSEKHQTQMQNQGGASIADYDYQHEHRYDDIPVQSLNGPFEEQPNYSIAAYDEEQKKKQKQMQTASFGVLAKQLGKSLIDSAKFIASGYVQKIKSSLNKMLSEAVSEIKKKVNENRSSRIQVTHDVSITGMRDHAKMGHSEIKMGRTIKVYGPDYSDYLAHHGIRGMHWGVRRFQNEDGSLTDRGRKRYSTGDLMRKGSELLSKGRDVAGRIRGGRTGSAYDRAMNNEGRRNEVSDTLFNWAQRIANNPNADSFSRSGHSFNVPAPERSRHSFNDPDRADLKALAGKLMNGRLKNATKYHDLVMQPSHAFLYLANEAAKRPANPGDDSDAPLWARLSGYEGYAQRGRHTANRAAGMNAEQLHDWGIASIPRIIRNSPDTSGTVSRSEHSRNYSPVKETMNLTEPQRLATKMHDIAQVYNAGIPAMHKGPYWLLRRAEPVARIADTISSSSSLMKALDSVPMSSLTGDNNNDKYYKYN